MVWWLRCLYTAQHTRTFPKRATTFNKANSPASTAIRTELLDPNCWNRTSLNVISLSTFTANQQAGGSFATSTPFLLEFSLVWSNEPTFFVCSNLCHNSKRGCYWNCAQAYYWQVCNNTCELKEFVQTHRMFSLTENTWKLPPLEI